MLICKTRKWGSSIGIVIPKSIADELKLREDEEVSITLTKKENVLKELFGSGNFKKPTEEILDEIRGKESKFL